MRKLIIVCSIVYFPIIIFAQHFAQAPKDTRPVKKITEWTTFLADEDDPEETFRDAVYLFKKDGKLDKWISNNAMDEIYTYHYDNKNRLDEVIIENDDLTRKIKYTYFEDRRLAEIQEQLLDLRTIQYFDKKGKIVEEKTFWKGELTGDKWETMSRKLYNYNAQDSLFGEMEYKYIGEDKFTKKKTVHLYDQQTNKKTSQIYYNERSKPEKSIEYKYSQTGHLAEKIITYHISKSKETTEYKYKNGILWQEITIGEDYKYEKVYKNGRYIRFKEFDINGNLIWYTDFQYEFY